MFCDNCGRNVPNAKRSQIRKISIRQTVVPVSYNALICGICGEEIYDDDVEAKIMKVARESYRTQKGMLSVDTLRNYMKKNGLNANEMAERVGCAVGEIIAANKGVLLDPSVDAKIKKTVSRMPVKKGGVAM